jgi:hypothetical protein
MTGLIFGSNRTERFANQALGLFGLKFAEMVCQGSDLDQRGFKFGNTLRRLGGITARRIGVRWR